MPEIKFTKEQLFSIDSETSWSVARLDLAKLPAQARYENSCRPRTSLESRPNLTPFGGEEVTIYLTSSGEVCLFDENASDLPISSFFSLMDVKDVSYHGKKVKNRFSFHTGTLFIVALAIIWISLVLLVLLDYIFYYDIYYYASIPEIDASETVSEGSNAAIWVMFFILFYSISTEYILKKLAVWSDAERIDFILEGDEKISLYGKFPFESRISLHRYAFGLVLFVLIPIVLFIPQMILFFFVVEILAVGGVLILQSLGRMVLLDPDENEGSVEISGLKDFFDGVKSLSLPDVNSNREMGKTTFRFEHLVDRLSDEVSSLSERLQVHEKALDEVTNEKWRYTLRVPEVDQGLTQIRKCTERLLFQRVIDLGITTGPRAGLDEMKSILEKNKAITSKPLSDLEVILAKTSPGSHATTGYAESDDDYITALRALANLVEWHFDNS